MVVVKPTRVMTVPSDEEEVDHDDDDQKGADGEHQQVRVHGRLPLGEPRIAGYGHQSRHRKDGDADDSPLEKQGDDKERARDEQDAWVGKKIHDLRMDQKIENFTHRSPPGPGVWLTRIQ